MAEYQWKAVSGTFNDADNWIDVTTGENPADTSPDTGDTAGFSATGGTISGVGGVDAMYFDQGAATPWVLNGQFSADSGSIATAVTLTSTTTLTINGVAQTDGYLPYGLNINGAFEVAGGILDSSTAGMNIGAPYSPTAAGGAVMTVDWGGLVKALSAVVGAGQSGTLRVIGNGSSFNTAEVAGLDAANETSGKLSIGQQATVNGITSTGAGEVDVANGGEVTIDDGLNLGEDAGSTGIMTVASSGVVTLSRGYSEVGNLAGSNGTLTVNADGTFLQDGGTLVVGNAAGATGTVTVNADGSFTSQEPAQTAAYLLVIGIAAATASQPAANGTFTVTGPGALLDMRNNPVAVGYAGTGALNVLLGAIATVKSINSSIIAALSVGRSGIGTVTVNGTGSLLTIDGSLYAGRAAGATGTVTVTNDGKLVQAEVNSTDAVTIGGGGAIGSTYAYGGTGVLNVTYGGSAVIAGALSVGSNGDTGTVLLRFGTLEVAGLIAIGTGTSQAGGTGTVDVAAGGVLTSDGPDVSGSASIALGAQVGTTGSLKVESGGSVSAGNNRISVGSRGTGDLSIADGGTVSSGSSGYAYPTTEAGFSIGNYASGTGTVEVQGLLVVNGIITVGGTLTAFGGLGALTVTNATGYHTGQGVSASGLVLWTNGTVSVDSLSTIGLGAPQQQVMADGGYIEVGTSDTLAAHGGTIEADVRVVGGAFTNAGLLTVDGSLYVEDRLANSTGVMSVTGSVSIGTSSGDGQSTLDVSDVLTIDGDLKVGTAGIYADSSSPSGSSGYSSLQIEGGSSVEVKGSAAGSYVGFNGTSAALTLDQAGVLDLDIVSGQSGDVIDLVGLTDFVASGNIVYRTVNHDSFNTFPTLEFVYLPDDTTAISLQSDGHGGTLAVIGVACYCRGTTILTDRGERPVEALAAGDVVVTATGSHRPISWVGRRSYRGRFLAANPRVQPVRFRAGALDGGLPRRDLLVSPEHAMFVSGVLVPARLLVNGSTIVQDGRLPEVEYFHIELASHDILLAEGAPSESFVDDDSRALFENVAEWKRIYPDHPRVPAVFCAPRVEGGPMLDAIRQQLRRQTVEAPALAA